MSDTRLDAYCVYCGNHPETRDHVPSKVLLDEPFPDNLPVVPSCNSCNQSFSTDEVYLACLIECVLHGSTDPANLEREKIKRILTAKPWLRKNLEDAKIIKNGLPFFRLDMSRIEKVVQKLACGHAVYENSEAQLNSPMSFTINPYATMSALERKEFHSTEMVLLPEVGSRSLLRLFTEKERNGWIEVKKMRYSYAIYNGDHGVTVKILISNYLACEVNWD